MGTNIEPNYDVEKLDYFNIFDEAFPCRIILRDLLFHVDSMTTPNEVWLNIKSFFWNTDDMWGNWIENELISLNPTHFEKIQDFFTKFKSLVLQLK